MIVYQRVNQKSPLKESSTQFWVKSSKHVFHHPLFWPSKDLATSVISDKAMRRKEPGWMGLNQIFWLAWWNKDHQTRTRMPSVIQAQFEGFVQILRFWNGLSMSQFGIVEPIWVQSMHVLSYCFWSKIAQKFRIFGGSSHLVSSQ